MKRIETTAIAAAVLLALGASAQADVLLYGWNGDTQGWTGDTITGTSPSVGVTEGTGALEFDGDTHYNYGPSLRSADEASTVLDALVGRTLIAFDAIMVNPEANAGQNWRFQLRVGGVDGNGDDFAAYATYVGPDMGTDPNRVGGAGETLIFDYSTIASGALTLGTAQSVYFYIRTDDAGGLAVNDTNDDLVVDNFRVVPEPASLALLGTGAVVIGLRRREEV